MTAHVVQFMPFRLVSVSIPVTDAAAMRVSVTVASVVVPVPVTGTLPGSAAGPWHVVRLHTAEGSRVPHFAGYYTQDHGVAKEEECVTLCLAPMHQVRCTVR